MLWDVALPVLAALAQVLTGFLGWRVTVDGVREERKRVYEWLFALASLIGVVAVGIAAYRGSQISHDLADLKRGQEKANAGIQHIETTPPSVTVNPQINIPPPPPPKEHTYIEYEGEPTALLHQGFPDLRVRLQAQVQPEMVFAYGNAGGFPAERPSAAGIVVLVSIAKAAAVFEDNRKLLKFTSPSGTLVPRSLNGLYHTAPGPMLTDDDITKIKNRELDLCGIGAVKWSDATGRYETRFTECLQAESDHRSLNWHIGKEHNVEHKLN